MQETTAWPPCVVAHALAKQAMNKMKWIPRRANVGQGAQVTGAGLLPSRALSQLLVFSQFRISPLLQLHGG